MGGHPTGEDADGGQSIRSGLAPEARNRQAERRARSLRLRQLQGQCGDRVPRRFRLDRRQPVGGVDKREPGAAEAAGKARFDRCVGTRFSFRRVLESRFVFRCQHPDNRRPTQNLLPVDGEAVVVDVEVLAVVVGDEQQGGRGSALGDVGGKRAGEGEEELRVHLSLTVHGEDKTENRFRLADGRRRGGD